MAIWDDLVAYYPGGSEYDLWNKFKVSLTSVTVGANAGPAGVLPAWTYSAFLGGGYADIPQPIPNSTGIFTISLWFKNLNSGNCTGVSLTSNYSPIRIASAGTDLGVRHSTGAFFGSGYNPSGLAAGVWHHLVVTADGAGGYTYYINGTSVGTATAPAGLFTDFLTIGNLNSHTKEFAEYLSEIAFWQREITPTEVSRIYTATNVGHPLDRLIEPQFALPGGGESTSWADMSNNIVLYHLDDVGTANHAHDDSGNNFDGSGSNVSNIAGLKLHSGSYTPPGVVLASGSFYNGTNAVVDSNRTPATLDIDGNKSRSIVMWLSSSNWQNDDVIWTMGQNSSGQDFSLVTKTTNRISLNTWGNDAYWDIPSSPLGWNHYAITYHSGTYEGKFYFNGNFVGTHAFGSSRNTSNSNTLKIGGPNYQWGYFPGAIQEIAIFSGSVLSDSDIRSIYNYQVANFVPSTGSATLDTLFSTVVHGSPSDVALDTLFGTVVHDLALGTVALDSLIGTIVHGVAPPSASLPDITGTVGIPLCFDSTGSVGVEYYHWSWTSVPSGSSIGNTILPLPSGGALGTTTPFDMNGNMALFHFEQTSTISYEEDFESTPIGSLPGGWSTWGDNVWQVTGNLSHGRTVSVGSGDVADNQQALLAYTASVAVDSQISFWWNVSSEAGWDKLKFYLNGVFQDEISGAPGWTQQTYVLPVGTHHFKWQYVKDVVWSAGLDMGWVDDISIGTVLYASDSSGLQNSASIDGPTQLSGAGYVGNYCYAFDGIDDTMTIHYPAGIFAATTGVSCAAWVKKLATTGYKTIFGMGSSKGFQLGTANGEAYFTVQNGGWIGTVNDAATLIPTNTWTHVVGTYDSTTLKIYINGVEIETNRTTTAGAINYVGSGFPTIGYSNGSDYWTGSIDELALWDRAISAEEVRDIYFLQSGGYAGIATSSLCFTPDVNGTYTMNLEIGPSVSASADAVIGSAAAGTSSVFAGWGISTYVPDNSKIYGGWEMATYVPDNSKIYGGWQIATCVPDNSKAYAAWEIVTWNTASSAAPLPCISPTSSEVHAWLSEGLIINNYLNLAEGRAKRNCQVPFKLNIKDNLGLRWSDLIATPSGTAPTFCTSSCT